MNDSTKRFGTFSGVFITNVLTIFGVILFYREGWLVGNAGLLGALSIIILANLVTFTTSLSISAIATNIKVKVGGAYYIVSRSLGPEIGGAIGISLFFAQSFSIGFYIIGFTMSLKMFFPFVDIRILSMTTLLVITLIAIINANIAIKIQFGVFILIMLALFSFFMGNTSFSVKPQLVGSFSDGSYWKTFAIFFPAVTGIFAGVSLSGDLKDPAKNIPYGTILSVLFTFVFYILVAIFLAYNIDVKTLLEDGNIMYNSSHYKFIILLGIWAATVSSALGSLLAAPRTLQALAADGIIPHFFEKTSGKTNEPRRAMLVSVALAGIILMIGDINFVAQLLTMFFLASYGIVNIIAAFETIIKNPAYRPVFKVHWFFSLFGGISSFAIMFLINKVTTVIALIIIAIIHYYLSRKNFDMNWGDMRKRFWSTIIDMAIRNYEKYTEHPRNWKPNVSLFENNIKNRTTILNVGSLLTAKIGIASYYIFKSAEIEDIIVSENNEELEIIKLLKERNCRHIYPKTVYTNKYDNAHLITLQTDGIASYKSNTILSDFDLDNNSLEKHLINLRYYKMLNKSVVLVKKTSITDINFEDRIDIWISGFKSNISLMLLIPFLIRRNPGWCKTKVYVRMVVRTDELKEKALATLNAILSHARVPVVPDIVSLGLESESNGNGIEPVIPHNYHLFTKAALLSKLNEFFSTVEQKKYGVKEREQILTVIKETSHNARMVIMGLNIPDEGKEHNYSESLKNILKDMPLTLLVKSNSEINLFK